MNFILQDDNENLPFEDYEDAVRALWGQILEQREKNLENKMTLEMAETEGNGLGDRMDELEVRYQDSIRRSEELRGRILDLSGRLEE